MPNKIIWFMSMFVLLLLYMHCDHEYIHKLYRSLVSILIIIKNTIYDPHWSSSKLCFFWVKGGEIHSILKILKLLVSFQSSLMVWPCDLTYQTTEWWTIDGELVGGAGGGKILARVFKYKSIICFTNTLRMRVWIYMNNVHLWEIVTSFRVYMVSLSFSLAL